MRLQKHTTRKVKDREYNKYVIVIPTEHIEELGWKEGQELEPEVRGRKLVISARENRNSE
jgi:bifunctional DNA-binding transcriptional regulator/antitoxin component of YhaV-PrlF toxin-antitoxin module